MDDLEQLRDRAARLLGLARKAKEVGKFQLSYEITKLATEAQNQTDEMDSCELQTQHEQHPQQQQQQQQPPPQTAKKD